uniref:Uncharacterized protein n=1 Tax=Plectus sambesii TaxID=2011161 RepID=A0A914UJ35_9BILA
MELSKGDGGAWDGNVERQSMNSGRRTSQVPVSPTPSSQQSSSRQRASLSHGHVSSPDHQRDRLVSVSLSGKPDSVKTRTKTVSLSLDTSPISPWSEDADNVQVVEGFENTPGEEDELLFPGYVETAFYCLSQSSIPRRWCLQLVNNQYCLHL